MKEIVQKLQKDRRFELFLDPVDAEGLGLIDYREIIKKPMDLSTLKKKIPSYTKIESFKDDLNLIAENCKKYNKEDSVSLLFKNITIITTTIDKHIL